MDVRVFNMYWKINLNNIVRIKHQNLVLPYLLNNVTYFLQRNCFSGFKNYVKLVLAVREGYYAKEYLEPCKTSKMERFAKTFNGF